MKVSSSSPQKAALVYLFLGMLPSGIKFFLLPVYINYLSPEDYGLLSILNVFSAAYGIIGSFQMNLAAGINFFKTDQKEHFEKTAISATLLLSFVSFLTFVALGPFVFEYFFQIPNLSFFPLGLMILTTGFLEQTSLVYVVLLKNTYRLKELSLYSILVLILSSGFQFYLIVFAGLGVMGSVFGSLIATAIMVVGILLYNRHLLTWRIDVTILRSCMKVALPMIPAVAIGWVTRFGDRVILEKYLDLHELGIYTLLINILGISLLIMQSLSTAIRPIFYQYLGELKTSQKQLADLTKKYVLVSLASISLVLLVGFNLELIISDERYLRVIPYLSLGVFVLLPQTLVKLPRLALAFQEKTGLISAYTLYKALAMVLLMVIMIPYGGIPYALIALAVASGIELVLSYFSFLKSGVPDSIKSNVFPVLISGLSIFGICWIGLKVDMSYGWIGIAQFVVTMSILYLYAQKEIHGLLYKTGG